MTPQDPLRREPRTVATMRLREALDMERQTSGGNAMTPLGVAGFIGGPWLDYIAEPYLTAATPPPRQEPAIDVERWANAVHRVVCAHLATIDPQQCIYGRQRDVALAVDIAAEYDRLGSE